MIDFLLEIGFEEFPQSFLKPSAEELSAKIEGLLKNKKIFYRSIRTIYTSRRMGVIVLGLSRKQKPRVIEIQGPPKKFAYDEKGKPTDMLLGFMNANNLKSTGILIRRTKKGDYVYGKKEITSDSTENILYNEIPGIIQDLDFPKTMVWNETEVRFPRPIRWIVALLDRKPLRFKYAGVEADRYSWPNQHFSFKPIRLEKPREYMNFLRHGGVVVDPNERKKIILSRIKQVAERLKGNPLFDKSMIEEINCTTEYPEVTTGEFDVQYLDLPEEVLMTVLKAHGNLIWIKDTNKFIYIFSAKKKAIQNVRDGYKRVMKARLYDALFYYQNDIKQGINQMMEQTKGMMWLKDLGTLNEKAVRLSDFVSIFKPVPELDMRTLKRAALLCKADLLSQMIREKEFTSLQGIMGGYYAKAGGEDERIATVIKEHYLPRFAGDELPKTVEGAALSIADKLDNVIGAFLSGNRPSGSYDPLAVRRNGYAVISLIDNYAINFSLHGAIDKILKLYNKKFDANVFNEFFVERFTRYLQDKRFRYDEVNAVLADWNGDVTDARLRCEALRGFRDKPDFTKLVIGQKRVRNILRGVKEFTPIDEELIKEAAEKSLLQKADEIKPKLETMFENKYYTEVLELLLGMRPVIDKFFDDVLVMCEDEKLRENRLALVNSINGLFSRFGDFSQIVIEGDKTQE